MNSLETMEQKLKELWHLYNEQKNQEAARNVLRRYRELYTHYKEQKRWVRTMST